MTFADALKKLPTCISGLDPMRHETTSDLRHLVELQIELFEDGEESDIRTRLDLSRCREFLEAS